MAEIKLVVARNKEYPSAFREEFNNTVQLVPSTKFQHQIRTLNCVN